MSFLGYQMDRIGDIDTALSGGDDILSQLFYGGCHVGHVASNIGCRLALLIDRRSDFGIEQIDFDDHLLNLFHRFHCRLRSIVNCRNAFADTFDRIGRLLCQIFHFAGYEQ